MATFSPFPIYRFFYPSGAPLAGGKLYTYAAGRTTPLTTYTDAGAGTANTNPIILDANGQCPVPWLADLSYKFVLTDSVNNTLWTQDNIVTANAEVFDKLWNPSFGTKLIRLLRSAAGAITQTLFSWIESREYTFESFGAVGGGVVDDTAAIQLALASGYPVKGMASVYGVSAKLTINIPGTRVFSPRRGLITTNSTTFKWIGGASADPIVYVANNTHGVCIEGIRFDCNSNAAIGLHIDVADADSTHMPKIHDCYFTGYTSRGLVLGANSTTTLCSGQLSMVDMQRVWFLGGSVGAIGILLNAQNCEWASCRVLYFSPVNPHLHHIFAYAGGLSIDSMITTQASDYAIYSNSSQVVVRGWRGEDRYFLKVAAVQVEGPCALYDVVARGSTSVDTDYLIDFGSAGTSELTLINCRLNGSVYIGPTNDLKIDASVHFIKWNGAPSTADFIFANPSACVGRALNLTTGQYKIDGYYSNDSINVSLTAFAGGGQANATLLTKIYNAVTTCATAGDSIKLPEGIGSGRLFSIRNTTGNSCNVFPFLGESINELAVNAPYALAAGASVTFVDAADNFWMKIT